MGYSVAQNNTTEPLLFLLVSSSDHISPLTGATPTVTLSKNGGAFAAPVGAVSEVGSGWYAVAANALDANTLGPLVLHATATGADPADDQYEVLDPTDRSATVPGVPTTGVVSFTGGSLIAGAMRLLGALGAGETLDSDLAATGLEVLNELLDGWQTQALLLYSDQRVVLTWTAGQSSLTIGRVGADLTEDRPLTIKAAGFLLASGYEYPMRVLTLGAWANVVNKDFGATYPRGVYYEPTFPNGTLYLWPVPQGSISLVLYVGAQLGAVQNLTDLYQLPPGYLRALRYNLADALGAELGLAVPARVAQMANDAKADIKRQNLRLADLSSRDVATLGMGGRRLSNSTLEAGRF